MIKESDEKKETKIAPKLTNTFANEKCSLCNEQLKNIKQQQ